MVAALPGPSHEVVRVVARHADRERVVEDRPALEELVHGAVPGGAERRTTGRAVDVHGAIVADVGGASGPRLCWPAMEYVESLLDLIGNTPLVRLHGTLDLPDRRARSAGAREGRVPQPRRVGEGPDRGRG